ncbi:MerR family transcriptional regulator [Microbacterium sp. NPDC055683]
MKLSELSLRSGASVPTLKYWMREGILPPGALRNQTTAVYDERHRERVALIRTLREDFDLPIVRIRRLVSLIDDPGVPLLDVMQECQLIAVGLAPGGDGDDSGPVRSVIRDLGWPDAASIARDALASALDDAVRAGVPFSTETLTAYGRALAPFAAADIAVIHPEGSRDAVARGLLRGAAAQARVLLAMNQLAHTSEAIRRTRGRGPAPASPSADD